MEKTLLWLDDCRDPMQDDWLNFSPIGKNVMVIWVKNYDEFINYIKENGIPDAICFDHDLGENSLSGYECAKFLVQYCIENNLDICAYNIQSANPVGRDYIKSILDNWHNFYLQENSN